MKTDPRYGSAADAPSSPNESRTQSSARTGVASKPQSDMAAQKKVVHDTSTTLLSAEEIEQVLHCVEETYGSELSGEMKKTMREEITTAVPELTKALLPIVAAAGRDASDPERFRQDWIKAFMGVMLPRMQKIVSSTPK